MEEAKQEENPEAAKSKERIQIRDITADGTAKTKDVRYTKRFFMDWTDEDGVKHSGEFTIKRPTIEERARIGTLLAELRDDKPPSSLDRSTSHLHQWIAICSTCVTQSPPWFKPLEMYDAEPLERVYLEALAFQESFRKAL